MKQARFTQKRNRSSRILATVAVLGAASLALAGCSSGETNTEAPVSSEPIEVWSWVPNISNIVDSWNAENPEKPVKLSQQAAGNDATFAKMVAASKSGTAPCLAQTDIKWVTSLVSQGVLMDVSEKADKFEDDYVPGGWSSVNIGDATYGLPIGSGPMVLYYNKTKLTEYGIEVPTTWEEYAAAAKKVAAEHPGEYLAGLSSDDGEKVQSYVQQAGDQWWSIDGDQWKVETDGAGSQKVAELWQGMVDAKAVNPTKRWDPAFYNDVASGKVLSVVGAAWEAPLLKSNAEAVSGDWSVAQMPTWSKDEQTTANNGGSQLMVLEGCKNVEGSLDFAHYLTTKTDALLDLGLFPAVKAEELPTPEALKTFFGGADVYQELQTSAKNMKTPWVFAPTYSSFSPKLGDRLNDAVTGKGTVGEAFDAVQELSLSTMKDAGISASAGQ